MSHILYETRIAAPVDAVWQALRDAEIIRNWFGWDTDSLGDEIDFIFIKGVDGEDAETHTLPFGEWEGTSDTFELTPDGDGTLFRIVRSGERKAEYNEVVEGWITFVGQLKLLMERHRGETRRTIYVSTRTKRPRDLLPPGGELWHESLYQTAVLMPDWGDGLLVLTDRPEGGYAVLTTFGMADAAFEALKAEWTAKLGDA